MVRQYDDFVRRHFRRKYLTAEELLKNAKLAGSKRRDAVYPKVKPVEDITAAPIEKRVHRHLSLNMKKLVVMKRYGSLTDFSQVCMLQCDIAR